MEELIKIVQDLGIYACFMIVVLFLGLKYIPKFLDVKLERMKSKDYMYDSFKSVVENNSEVIKNNSEVIKLNSATIKNYTENSNKLENKIDDLSNDVKEVTDILNNDVKEVTKILSDESVDIKVIKEKV